MAEDFQWAIWVGFKPGVRDTAGAVALEAIAAYLGQPLPTGAAVYTSKLFLLTGDNLTENHAAQIARELLANDMVQEFRIFSRETWDPDQRHGDYPAPGGAGPHPHGGGL